MTQATVKDIFAECLPVDAFKKYNHNVFKLLLWWITSLYILFPPYLDFNWLTYSAFKGTVMQTEKTLINDHLRVSKLSWKFHIPTIYNSAEISTVSIVISVYKQNFTAQ